MKLTYQDILNIGAKIAAKAGRISMFVLFFVSLPMVLEWYVLNQTEQEDWYEYEKVSVLQSTAVAGADPLKFVSFSHIKQPVKMEWNDVLYCNSGNGFEFVTSNQTSKKYTEPESFPKVEMDAETGKEVFIPWRYPLNGNVLHAGEVCYLESTMVGRLRFDITFPSTLRSAEFTVRAE